MSEDERKNDQNKEKQKMKSAHEQEFKPVLQEFLAQVCAMSPKKPRTPRCKVEGQSTSQSTDLLPLDQGKTGTGLLVSGSVSGTIPSSAAVQVNRNKQKSSRVVQGNKKIATGKNKGIVIKEVLEKRPRPSSYINEQLPKGSICDSDFDRSTDDDTDESDGDYSADDDN